MRDEPKTVRGTTLLRRPMTGSALIILNADLRPAILISVPAGGSGVVFGNSWITALTAQEPKFHGAVSLR
ncbi:hypothetical protein FACS189450_00060 [Spirochaetia bacterium]|nr:hypothetical protein FACS189450_00060 [Spirochaetia bacterium]